MSEAPGRPGSRRRGPGRLALRVYAVSLVLVFASAFTLDFLRRHVLEPSQQRGTLQLARLVTTMVTDTWPDEAALAHHATRLREVLDADFTVFSLNGQVLATNEQEPPAPLDLDGLSAPLSPDTVSWQPPRTAVTPIVHGGVTQAYITLTPRAPRTELETRLLTLGLILVLVGVGSALLSRSIARRLSHLTQVARAFGNGDLRARANIRSSDELGELGRAFDEMADRTAHLVRAQKELLANISHELRTPLSRLRVALDLAIERGDERRMELLTRDVQEDLSELEQMLTDVMLAARLDLSADRATATPMPLKKRPLAADELLDGARERFEKAHPERTLVVETRGELPSLEGDLVLLRRALDNLLDNAVRYSEQQTPIALRASAEGGRLVVEVVDRGIGIAPEDLPHVFEPFYRADRSRSRASGGVGLGLVLARRIVEAHGGRLSVESSEQVGTTFRVVV